MSIPLLLNQDSNISNRNLNISKKISSHNENQEEKNKFNVNICLLLIYLSFSILLNIFYVINDIKSIILNIKF